MTFRVDDQQLEGEVAALLAGERCDDPYPTWNRVREQVSILRVGSAFVVPGYGDCMRVLGDRDRFSGALARVGVRHMIADSLPEDVAPMWRELMAFEGLRLGNMEGDEHNRMRQLVHRYFTPNRVRALEEAMRGFVDELVDELAGREVYDHRRFARELPMRVMTHMLGAPHVDGPYILERVATFEAGIQGTTRPDLIRAAWQARVEFGSYIDEVILAEHRRNPGVNELVSALMGAEADESLTPTQLSGLAFGLVAAGIETTSLLLTNGLLELLRNRRQWELLCADPSLAANAVEELLRYVSPVQFTTLVARHDVWLHGLEVPAGALVMCSVAAAHRDPGVYDDPDTLNIATGGRRPQLAFGYGPHYCLGQALVRSEARIMLESLAGRYPQMELAVDPADLDWSASSSAALRSVKELPIRLGPRRS